MGTGAEPTCDGCGRNFSIVAPDAGADDDEAAADGGKCVAAWAGGWRRARWAVQGPRGTCAWVRRNFSRGQQAGATGEEAAEGRKCEGGAVNGSGRESVHDTTCDPLVEPNRCQVGPTILFECPAKIPRSSPRSFSLWATPGSYRHDKSTL